jgi:hypothetical protein
VQRSFAFGRQWIGPVLFPFYIRVLTFNLGLTFFILTVIFAALYIGGQTVHIQEVFSNFLLQLVIQFTAVTVIFSLVENHLNRHPDHWRGQKVKTGVSEHIVGDIASSSLKSPRQKNIREVSRFESVSIIVASAVALIWMQAVWSHLFLIFGPAASFLRLAPVWHQIYWPTIAIVFASILRATINLIRPDWIRFRAAASVLFEAAGLLLVCVLINAQHYVVLAGEVSSQATSKEHMLQVVNQWTYYALWGAAVAAVVQTVGSIIRLVRTIHGPSAVGI